MVNKKYSIFEYTLVIAFSILVTSCSNGKPTPVTLSRATTLPSPLSSTSLPTQLTKAECVRDQVNHFSLLLSPGWRVELPDSITGNTFLYNYREADVVNSETFPPSGLKIQIGTDILEGKQSTEQWLAERISANISAVPVVPTVSSPIDYRLGKYKGKSYTVKGYGPDAMEIVLIEGNQIFIIGLIPSTSPALKDALLMLETIELSTNNDCSSN